METIIVRTTGQVDLKLDLHRPPAPAPGRPAVLWLHGGALILGSRALLAAEQRDAYLAAGVTIAAPDYRLAPETKLPEILSDVEAAYAWLRAHADGIGVDPGRISIVGHSAGGYLALSMGRRLTPRPQGLVSFYGYGDIAGDWLQSPSPHYLGQERVSRASALAAVGTVEISEGPIEARLPFYIHTRQEGCWTDEVAGPGVDLRPYCPVLDLPPDYPPTLLFHGDLDDDVPASESIAMAAALAARGIRHTLHILHGRGHDFDIAPGGLSNPDAAGVFAQVLDFVTTGQA